MPRLTPLLLLCIAAGCGAHTTAAVATAPPAAPAASASPAAGGPLAVAAEPGCQVIIDALLDANVYRGHPDSPMLDDARRADPDAARMDDAESHGEQYLECRYAVRVNGVRFAYAFHSDGGPAVDELDPAWCGDDAHPQAAAAGIASFTDHCRDLHRGEYYGDVLEPLP